MNKPGRSEEISLMKPFVPPMRDILPYLERILESRQLTNGGRVHSEFEQTLCEYLGVKHISLFANGTLALMLGLKALKLKGEIITTPFTSPATLQAIYWNNLKPVFVDIMESDLTIDPDKIETAITHETSALLPVHIFGNPCNIDKIDQLSHRYSLKVIYDAAHCFGIRRNGDSLCHPGDLSVLSFHATKVFNTIEGGAIVCHDEATRNYIEALKNSGIDQYHKVIGCGLNAKMNEIQAAFGLCQLKYIDGIIEQRKAATLKYRQLLKGLKGIRTLPEAENVKQNYTYFPVIIDPVEFGADRDQIHDHLKQKNIISRKYFYPLVSDLPEFRMYKNSDLPNAQKIAKNILCLPLFHDITDEQIKIVSDSIFQLHRVTG